MIKRRVFHRIVITFCTVTVFVILGCISNFSYDNFYSPSSFSSRQRRLIDTLNELSRTFDDNTAAGDITKLINLHNRAQIIRNYEKFGPVTNETVLITLQVHDRISYLKNLIKSLRASRDISKVLLIISHDVFNHKIDEIISEIDFCLVMQIFFPYSIQLHPFSFPGNDPNDCHRNETKIEAMKRKCNNWKHPDSYKHYRESKFTQMKHHWWWKLNRIFDQLDATKYHSGFLLLLEEDYVVSEDFIHVFKLLQDTLKYTPMSNVLTLGAYDVNIDEDNFDIFDVNPWTTDRHNMGMAFNRSTWNSIKNCAKFFCEYDEYNYDFSLQNINRKCLKKKLITNNMRGPRVFHMGTCGIHKHTNINDCELQSQINMLNLNMKMLEAKEHELLFPDNLKLDTIATETPNYELVNNGGWGDVRDQNLCMKMTRDEILNK